MTERLSDVEERIGSVHQLVRRHHRDARHRRRPVARGPGRSSPASAPMRDMIGDGDRRSAGSAAGCRTPAAPRRKRPEPMR